MHYRSFSRKRNINSLVTVTVTVTSRLYIGQSASSRLYNCCCPSITSTWHYIAKNLFASLGLLCVFVCVLQSCETWPLKKENEMELQLVENWDSFTFTARRYASVARCCPHVSVRLPVFVVGRDRDFKFGR